MTSFATYQFALFHSACSSRSLYPTLISPAAALALARQAPRQLSRAWLNQKQTSLLLQGTAKLLGGTAGNFGNVVGSKAWGKIDVPQYHSLAKTAAAADNQLASLGKSFDAGLDALPGAKMLGAGFADVLPDSRLVSQIDVSVAQSIRRESSSYFEEELPEILEMVRARNHKVLNRIADHFENYDNSSRVNLLNDSDYDTIAERYGVVQSSGFHHGGTIYVRRSAGYENIAKVFVHEAVHFLDFSTNGKFGKLELDYDSLNYGQRFVAEQRAYKAEGLLDINSFRKDFPTRIIRVNNREIILKSTEVMKRLIEKTYKAVRPTYFY